LQEYGYAVHLANPSAIKQYQGLKHTDDQWDSLWLAYMFRLGILRKIHLPERASSGQISFATGFREQTNMNIGEVTFDIQSCLMIRDCS